MSGREHPSFFEYVSCDNHFADEWGYLHVPDFDEWSPIGLHNQFRLLTGAKVLFFQGEGIEQGPILKYFLMGQMKPHKSKYWMYCTIDHAYPDIWVRDKIPPSSYMLNVFNEFISPRTVRVSLCNLAGSEICHVMSSTSENVFHTDVIDTLMEVLPHIDMECVRFVYCVRGKTYTWGLWSSVGGPPQNALYSCDEEYAAVRASVMIPMDNVTVPRNKRVICKTGLEVESAIRLRDKTTVKSMFIDGTPYRFVRSYKFVKRTR